MKSYFLAIALLLSGCGSLNKSYVQADRKRFEQLSPRILKMLKSTKEYDKDQKEDIKDRLNAWDAATTQGMKNVK